VLPTRCNELLELKEWFQATDKLAEPCNHPLTTRARMSEKRTRKSFNYTVLQEEMETLERTCAAEGKGLGSGSPNFPDIYGANVSEFAFRRRRFKRSINGIGLRDQRRERDMCQMRGLGEVERDGSVNRASITGFLP
jgi:hypothetical protein